MTLAKAESKLSPLGMPHSYWTQTLERSTYAYARFKSLVDNENLNLIISKSTTCWFVRKKWDFLTEIVKLHYLVTQLDVLSHPLLGLYYHYRCVLFVILYIRQSPKTCPRRYVKMRVKILDYYGHQVIAANTQEQ